MKNAPRDIGIFLAVLLLLAAGAALLLRRHGAEPAGIPRDEALRLIELRNLGVGFLENEDSTHSDPLLLELTRKLPADPLGPRNLTISRSLALEQINAAQAPQDHQAALAQAREALNLLQAVSGDSAVTHLLAGRIARQAGEEMLAVTELTQATELAPADPALWYALFLTARNLRDDAHQRQARLALERAFELRPENLFLLTDWLLIQAQQHDPALIETLRQAQASLQPLAETIRAQTRVDLLNVSADAVAAVEQGDWAAAERQVRALSNVLRPDPAAQSDRLAVDKHPLEYILFDFGADFYRQADLPSPEVPAAIPVTFSRHPLPPLSATRQMLLAEFDLDDQPDLLWLGEKRIECFGRKAETGSWQRLTGIDLPGEMQGLLAADLDDDVDARAPREGVQVCLDADIDLVAFGPGGAVMLENRFDPETRQRSLVLKPQEEDWERIRDVRAACLADLDHDGDLDLVLAAGSGLSLWSNRGNLTFENIDARSQLPPASLHVTALAAVDWDRDADLDIILIGKQGAGILENVRHGRLRWRPWTAEQVGRLAGASALAPADLKGNGAWDLLSCGEWGLAVTATQRTPTGLVTVHESRAIDETPGHALQTWDYDNDGLTDLLFLTASGLRVYRGLGGGHFEPQQELSELLPPNVAAFTTGDFDRDGDLDLAVATAESGAIVANEGGNAHRWIDISLRGQQVKGGQSAPSGRVNHQGIGSLLELKAGLRDQMQMVTGQVTHFGLGTLPQADVIRVLWTNGVPRNVMQPSADEQICELQTLKGSCPYLYTWTGSRYEFLTDLLWAAPIGLQFAEGVVAPWREWEYLKIPGERLLAQAGAYRLQITEELWEAAYFDQVRLFAIDHPADVEIFTNEKVGPAALAEHQIHTVRERRLPVAARNQQGRDVLPELSREDGNLLKAFDHKLRQGLTDEHSLELDLGDLSGASRITLFLSGWVYPTDTSINVALSQNPLLEAPRPPALWVPDPSGVWQEVRPFMGFPGGKTKTIAIDLSQAFLSSDYRLRIVTNMEFYWDAVFFTADEPPAEWQQTELALTSADLHWRGFSRRIADAGNGPEIYDYEAVSQSPAWPPMEGDFTRYGTVTELLRDQDDLLVILGAGDELTLSFAPPDRPLPPGWKRDFVIFNAGWDKDADLNTVYGQTVEPLPFREMKFYGDSPPKSARYSEYLQTYQTRRQNRSRFWNQVRQFDPGSDSITVGTDDRKQ